MALDNAYPSGTTPPTQLTTAAQWESFFVAGLGGATGIAQGVGGNFAGSLNSGTRSAVLAAGAAMIRGFYVNGGSSVSTAIPAASSQNRIDRLVLRLDRTASAAGNWILPVVIEGTPSSNPQIPALATSLTGSYDLPICHWTSAANGSLTGLVDERLLRGSGLQVFPSTSRPPASQVGLGIESDTGRVMRSDGSAWTVLASDTGWIPFPYGTPWNPFNGSVPGYRKVQVGATQRVYLRGSLVQAGRGSQPGNPVFVSLSAGVTLGTLPPGFRPAWDVYPAVSTQYTTEATARMNVSAAGVVTVQGPQSVNWLSMDGVDFEQAN